MSRILKVLPRAAVTLLGVVVAAGILGGNCTGLTIDLPLPGGGSIQLNTVTVELWNTTGYAIEPRLFVDPEDDSLDVDDDANRVWVDPVIEPGEVRVLTMTCAATGAIETDHARMLLLFGQAESDNDPIVRRHDDFDCGDTVTFVFIDEGDDFYTRVEVNGEFVED